MDIGWRIAFGIGAVFGLVVLLVRRNVPESQRWLFIHGRQDEAERYVGQIEQGVRPRQMHRCRSRREKALTIRQRKTIPFREIAKVAFTLYPKRAVLGLALFIGQAFFVQRGDVQPGHPVERVLRRRIRDRAGVLRLVGGEQLRRTDSAR